MAAENVPDSPRAELAARSLLENELMRRFFWILQTLATIAFVGAAPLPLTTKDVSLMLRSGYSSDAVLQELSARKFADTLDSAGEVQLQRAGASQALISALRSGNFQASSSEIAALKQQTASHEVQLKAAERYGSDIQTAGGSNHSSAASTPTNVQAGGGMFDHLRGDLVYWHNGSLVPFDDEVLERKKLYLLFFSAIWSKEGRQFTTRLGDYYNRAASQHPEFEVVFFSADRSAFAMENYISEANMPWPVVAYEKLGGKAGALADNFRRQIPRLVLADASGKVLSDSGEGQPDFDKVLAELDKILNRAPQ